MSLLAKDSTLDYSLLVGDSTGALADLSRVILPNGLSLTILLGWWIGPS